MHALSNRCITSSTSDVSIRRPNHTHTHTNTVDSIKHKNRLLHRCHKAFYVKKFIYISNRFHNITVIRIYKSGFFLFLFFWVFFSRREKKMLNKFRAPHFVVSSNLFFSSLSLFRLSVLLTTLWHIWMSVLMKSIDFLCGSVWFRFSFSPKFRWNRN